MRRMTGPQISSSATASFRLRRASAVRRSLRTMRNSCRSRVLAWPGVLSGRAPSFARASACTTTCRTRSDIAWIRTRPSNPSYSIANLPVTDFPPPIAPIPAKATVAPAGGQPDMSTPTLISRSLRIEQELSPNTVMTLGYVDSHGYPRDCEPGRQRANPHHLPRCAVSSGVSQHVPCGPGRCSGACRLVLQPIRNAAANPALARTWAWFLVVTARTIRCRWT